MKTDPLQGQPSNHQENTNNMLDYLPTMPFPIPFNMYGPLQRTSLAPHVWLKPWSMAVAETLFMIENSSLRLIQMVQSVISLRRC